jgi:hypothetical protein
MWRLDSGMLAWPTSALRLCGLLYGSGPAELGFAGAPSGAGVRNDHRAQGPGPTSGSRFVGCWLADTGCCVRWHEVLLQRDRARSRDGRSHTDVVNGRGAATGGPAATSLVGRGAELAQLLALCDAGEGGAALVTGDAGIGKTRLLDEVAARVGAAGAVVLQGRAVPGGGALRPVVEALIPVAPPAMAEDERLGSFRAVLARLLPAWPDPAPVGPPLVDPVVILGEAVLELMQVVSQDRRSVLLLDDMHWADRDTLVLLDYLGTRPAPIPITMIIAARSDEIAPAGIGTLRRNARPVPMSRLADEHVAVLARRCAGSPVSDQVVDFLVSATDGLPLLVEELFAGLVESGRVRRDELGWHSVGPLAVRVPDAFADLVGHRVDALSTTARAVIEAAAVMGGELDARLLGDATGLDHAEVASGLRAGIAAALLASEPPSGVLRWRHALTRDAVLGRLTKPERVAWGRQVVDAMTLDADLLRGDRLALAAEICARCGWSRRGGELLLLLGREAIAAGALATADDQLRRAAELAEGDLRLVGEVAVEQVRVLALGARTDEAIAVGDAVLTALSATSRRDLAVALARACVAAERWAAAQNYLDTTTTTAASTTDPAVLALAAHVALGRGEPDEALRLARSAVSAGERDAVPEAVCEALEVIGRAVRLTDADASEAAFVHAERVAAAQGLTPWRVRAMAELGTNDTITGGPDTRRLDEARRLAEECGLLGTATSLDLQIVAMRMGSDGCVAALPIARRCAEAAQRLQLPATQAHALQFIARGMFWAGDPGDVEAVLDEAARIAPNPTNVLAAREALAGFAAWLDHDDAAASAGLTRAMVHMRASPNPAPLWGHWALLSTIAHPRDDGPREELRASGVLRQPINRVALQYADAVAAAARGHSAPARGLVAEGDAALAGKEHERLFLRCLLVGAVAAGGPAAGLADPQPWLREALARWEPAKEVRLARWCRERLRALGFTVPRPGRDHTAVPPRLRAMGVTGRELEVLHLVALGLSNIDAALTAHRRDPCREPAVEDRLRSPQRPGRFALTP